MGNFLDGLKKKGPGGIPIWIYGIGTVVLLYLGYRWYSNRSGSSSSAATSAPVDTTGTAGDSSASQPGDTSSQDGTTDTTPPDTTSDTAPPAGDSTGVINGPASIANVPDKKKKKAHVSLHDKKQGIKGTDHRAIHRRQPGTTQTKHAHAPKVTKRESSKTKAVRVVGPAAHATRGPVAKKTVGGETLLHGGNAPPPTIKTKVVKVPPPAVKQPEKAVAKAPPKKKK